MIKRRLLILADALDRLEVRPRKRFTFNLVSWFRREDCGTTTACAVGLATLLPEFKRLGLKMGPYVPTFRHHHGWTAVSKFFDIPRHHDEYLFSYSAYCASGSLTSPKAVADRIRAYVSTGKLAAGWVIPTPQPEVGWQLEGLNPPVESCRPADLFFCI